MGKILDKESSPRLLIWGWHEGIRGASWLEFGSDGIVCERRYLPGTTAEAKSQYLGTLPQDLFNEFVTRVEAALRENAMDRTPVRDPAHVLTLECIGEHSRREWTFSPEALDTGPALRRLGHAFATLPSQCKSREGRNSGYGKH
jgi:hypothetical protein